MRIKVDLSDFLQDERKFSVLKVKPKETKTVQDVISKISYLFNVYGKEDDDQTRPRLGLFDEEFYIHPDETAAVLEDCGVLKLKSLPKPGTKGKKKKKAKKEPVKDDEERKILPIDEEEDKTVLGVQLMKIDKDNQASPKEVTGSGWLEVDEPRKASKKRKRCQFAGEVEDLHGKKRSRTEEWVPSLDESNRGEQHLKEWKEVEVSGEKKKRKKERANRELSISDTSIEEWRRKKKKQGQQQHSSQHSHDNAGSHKKSQQHVPQMEECEVPEPHLVDWKKQRLKDDKGGGRNFSSSSKDKVVSTSNVLTTQGGISLHHCRRTSKASLDLDFEMDGRKPCLADSVTDPLISLPNEEERENMLTKKKRKRKHRRSLKSDANTPQPNAWREAQNARGSEVRWPVLSGKLTPTTFSRTHIMFNSDEDDNEGGVTQAVPDQSCHQNKKIQPAHDVTPGQHNQPEAALRPTITGKVRDISKERRPPVTPTSLPSHGIRRVQGPSLLQNTEVEEGNTLYPEEQSSQYTQKGKELVHRRPAHNNLEELAKLRKICENNTITICKVDSRRDQPTKTREESRPTPSPPHNRAPPSPPHSSLQVIHDSRYSGSLQALAAMKNRSVPEVFSGVRAMGVRPIQGHSSGTVPARRPMANGSPAPASQNITSLPPDDPLQILSSNLNEIHQQYKQGCEQTQAGRRPAGLHSLGAVLSAMKTKPQSSKMESSLVQHDKEKPRTSPTSGNKRDTGGQGTADLLVLGCVDGLDSKMAASSRKKEGLPDIYCVSPSRPVQQASPSRTVPQPSPSRLVHQTSPSRTMLYASPSRPLHQATPSRIVLQTSPSRPVPQINPSRPLLQASLSRPLSQSILSRTLQQNIPSRPMEQAQNVVTGPPTPKWPVDEVVDLECEDQSEVVTCNRGDVKGDNVTVAAPPPVTAGENEKLVGSVNSSKEKGAVNTLEFSGNTMDKNTIVKDLHVPNKSASISGRPVEGGMSTGQYIAEILEDCEMVELSGSGAEKAGATDTQNKMAALVHHTHIMDEEEVVSDEDEVMLEDDEGNDVVDGKVMLEDDEGNGVVDGEVMLEDDEGYGVVDGEVMLEDDEGNDAVDGEGEEEGEEEDVEEEEEEEEEEEGGEEEEEEEAEEDDMEVEVVEEVQDVEEETDIYANIDDEDGEEEEEEEEEEEDDHDQSDNDFEIIKESGTYVSMAVEGQEGQSLASEDAKGSASLGNTLPKIKDSPPYPTVWPPKENISKILENGDQGQITHLVAESRDTTILTKPSEATSFVSKPLEIIPVMTKPVEATNVTTLSSEASPVMKKAPDVAAIISLSPKVLSVMTKSQEISISTKSEEIVSITGGPQGVTSILTEPEEDALVLLEPQDVTPTLAKPQKVRPILTEPQEVTPIITKTQVTSIMKKPQVTPIMTKPQPVTPVATEPEEITPVIIETEEITPVITEPEKVKSIMRESQKVTSVFKHGKTMSVTESEEAIRRGRPLEDSEGTQSEICQTSTAITATTSNVNSVELPKDAKPAKVSETEMEVVLVASSPPPQRSPSPEMINVTPAISLSGRSSDTQVHTLIHHTTITNILPSPSLLPPHHHPNPQNPQHHSPFRSPLMASPPFSHHQPHLNLSPSVHSPFLSLPAQFALGQLMNQSLYQSLPYPSPCPPTSVPTSPTCQGRFPSGQLSVAALRGAPLRTGGFSQALQQTHPHPLLGMPLSSLRLPGTPQQRHLMAMINPQTYSFQHNHNF